MLLKVKHLIKEYPGGVKAVNGVSFEIPEGHCFGLLGPNGAGKTTTVEMMEGILRPSSGEIYFRGQPIGAEFKERSGIQFQDTAIQDFLKVREVLEMFASFYQRRADLKALVAWCNLGEFMERDAHQLSGGQRQRLLLAVALVNDPDLVFLDEPTTGLDPQARRVFWDLVRSLKSQGKTIVLTTHYMEEAYQLCDEIAIMDQGLVIARGEPDRLLKKYFDTVTLELPREVAGGKLGDAPWKVIEREQKTEIFSSDVNQAVAWLIERKVNLAHLRIREPTLEDLFLQLTGKALRE